MPDTDGAEHFPQPVAVWRRFSDFEMLRKFLSHTLPTVLLPPLPEKSSNFKLLKLGADKFDPDHLEKRRAAFQLYMRRLLQHPKIARLRVIYDFLKIDKKWGVAARYTDANLAEHKWTPASMDEVVTKMMAKAQNPDRTFVEYQHYSTGLRTNLTSVLNAHAKITALNHSLQKQYYELAACAHSYAQLEDQTPLGAVLDSVSESYDELSPPDGGEAVGTVPKSVRTEELTVVAPLNEYLLYGASLQELLSHQEQQHWMLEGCQKDSKDKAREIEKQKKPEGISGFFRSLSKKSPAEEAAILSRLEQELIQREEIEGRMEAHTRSFNEVRAERRRGD